MLAESLEVSNKFPPNFFSQLVKAADEGESFLIRNSSTDRTVYRLCTSIFLGLNQVQDVLFEADISAMYADADAVVQIVKALTLRAAALISTALAGVIKAIANEKHSYAISGNSLSMKKIQSNAT